MYIYIELMRVRAKVAVKKKKKIKNIQTWMGAIRKRITSNDLQVKKKWFHFFCSLLSYIRIIEYTNYYISC